MKVLILGASGMLGYSLFSNLNDHYLLDVYGTVRSLENPNVAKYFSTSSNKIINNIDVNDFNTIENVIENLKPQILINCIGLIKQNDISKDYIQAIEINSLLPHKLAKICDKHSCRLIHFSTDCVFDGVVGMYTEFDAPNSKDLYGMSKQLGEVNYGRHLTLRTSIIGHELNSKLSLVDWFLSQSQQVNGYSKAVFSGLPTSYLADFLYKNILPNDIRGLYHLSVDPISKYDLLCLLAEVYGKNIDIIETSTLILDRSLNSDRLRNLINFIPPKWSELIHHMHKDFLKRYAL